MGYFYLLLCLCFFSPHCEAGDTGCHRWKPHVADQGGGQKYISPRRFRPEYCSKICSCNSLIIWDVFQNSSFQLCYPCRCREMHLDVAWRGRDDEGSSIWKCVWMWRGGGGLTSGVPFENTLGCGVAGRRSEFDTLVWWAKSDDFIITQQKSNEATSLSTLETPCRHS